MDQRLIKITHSYELLLSDGSILLSADGTVKPPIMLMLKRSAKIMRIVKTAFYSTNAMCYPERNYSLFLPSCGSAFACILGCIVQEDKG